MFGELYRILARIGINPREADEMELWEIGSILLPDAEESTSRGSMPDDFKQSSRELLAARLRHAQGQGPKPEPAVTDRSAMTLMARA